MVGEFPELQGVMGRYYALHDGEDPRVAEAIAEHYKPLGPNDTCPSAPTSVAVALADKIDSLVAFFAINEKPTGSRDPFALRRAALGMIRLILENRLRLPLSAAFNRAASTLADMVGPHAQLQTLPAYLQPAESSPISEWRGPTVELLAFIADRLKVHLREAGVRHDLIAAVFAVAEDDLVPLLARVDALSKFLGTEDGNNLLIAYRRASNILTIEDRKGGWTPGEVDANSLCQPEEQALFADLNLVTAGASRSLAREEFQAAMGHLVTLRRPVDEFFDKVTVNTDDPALRENRLRLLSRIRAVMNQVADFSQIEG